jgi:2',3'-cyclic-nucleotide 2'-phosphodiesterase (5'-nucleotidase family)
MGIKEYDKKDGTKYSDRRVFAVDRNFSEADALQLPERRENLKDNPFTLHIIHINDFHCSVYDFSCDDNGRPVFSKIAAEVASLRQAAEKRDDTGVLFLSGGDDAVGSPMDHLAGYDGENFICHPAYTAYALSGLDATVLGNHDFDAGLKTLEKAIAQDACFPVLSANLIHDGELDGLVFPAAVVVIKGLRIGIIGLTTPGQIRSRDGSKFAIAAPLESVRDMHAKLAGVCDVVLILSHIGYRLGSTFATVKIMGDYELAQQLDHRQFDAIIGGHTHDLLNIHGMEPKHLVHGIPILQAGYNGLFFGRAEMHIGETKTLVRAELFPTGPRDGSPEFDEAFATSKPGVFLPSLRQPLSAMRLPDDYDRQRHESLRDSFEHPTANFITDALATRFRDHGYHVDLFLIDGANMITFFPAGKDSVNIIDVYRLMPYADSIVSLTLTGKTLERIIRENALRLDREDEPHLERGFLHFSRELRYRLHRKSRTADAITINGRRLNVCLEEHFAIAMPNFAQGLAKVWEDTLPLTGKELCSLREMKRSDSGLYVRNELVAYIREHGVSPDSGFTIDGRLAIDNG